MNIICTAVIIVMCNYVPNGKMGRRMYKGKYIRQDHITEEHMRLSEK